MISITYFFELNEILFAFGSYDLQNANFFIVEVGEKILFFFFLKNTRSKGLPFLVLSPIQG